jgi:uncharacterized membrane protein
MLGKSIGFANLLVVALIAGTVFGIWLGYDPASLSPGTYIEQQQEVIRALNVRMPVLGATAILLTVSSAVLARAERRALYLLVAAVACLLVAGLVTRFGNQPINAIVMTWNAHTPPADWMNLRDEWWKWHIVRTLAMIGGLSLILLANPMGRRSHS